MDNEINDDSIQEEINAVLEGIGKKYKMGAKKVRSLIATYNKELPALTPQRALYNYFRGVYPPSVPLPMSYLRADSILGANSEITFNINETTTGVGNKLPVERRLKLNNTFEVLDIAIVFYTMPTTAGVPNQKFQTRKLYSYINPFIFATAAEQIALESVYNSGRIQYKLDENVLYPAIDCLRFLRVPVTQEGTITTVTDAGVVVGRNLRDGWEDRFPFTEMIPSLTLNGNGGNNFTIQMPESVDMAPVAGENRSNYCALLIRGFEGISGTQQSNRKRSV